MYTILSIIALCVEILLLGYFTYKTIKQKTAFSKKTIWYAAPVFILIYFLYTLGYIYTGKELTVFLFLKMIPTTLEAFVFKVDLDKVTPLALSNGWFFAATLIATLMAGATLVASIVSVWGARLKNNIRLKRYIKKGKEFVIGTSESALRYAKDNNAIVLSFDGIDKFKSFIGKNYTVYQGDFSKVNKQLNKIFTKGKMHHFIVFADNGFSYAQIISWFIRQFNEIDNCYFTLHIEASLSEMDIINRKFIDAKKTDNICVKSFNKYELLARKFIMDYPLSLYIPENFYGDYRTIKSGQKINVVCIGFGKVNYELLKLMIMQNQFVGLNSDKTKFTNYLVDYYVFDNSEDRICSDLLLKVNGDLHKLQGKDLPAPEPICNIAKIEKTNVFSLEFTEELQTIISNENAYTYIIVSIGNDYENMAYAEQLRDFYDDSLGCFKIFARVKDDKTLPDDDSEIVCFGDEKQILSRDVLINDSLDALARDLNKTYTNSSDEIASFNSRPTIEMYSNIYHIASIFFKMGLLGLKFTQGANPYMISKEELFTAYDEYLDKLDYKKYFKLNVWTMLGFSEHSRWVALYLLKGFKPMAYSDIKVQDDEGNVKIIGKDIENRKHCCLTDYYSLDKYHKHILKLYGDYGNTNITIDNVETYKYDYMFINDAYDKMIECGYALVKQQILKSEPLTCNK